MTAKSGVTGVSMEYSKKQVSTCLQQCSVVTVFFISTSKEIFVSLEDHERSSVSWLQGTGLC